MAVTKHDSSHGSLVPEWATEEPRPVVKRATYIGLGVIGSLGIIAISSALFPPNDTTKDEPPIDEKSASLRASAPSLPPAKNEPPAIADVASRPKKKDQRQHVTPARFHQLDRELERETNHTGLLWKDIIDVAPDAARKWMHWRNGASLPALEEFSTCYNEVKNALKSAADNKTTPEAKWNVLATPDNPDAPTSLDQ